jgi:pimeloyl-ACP methyl ester carboxylesterase
MKNTFLSKTGFLFCALLITIPSFVQGDLNLCEDVVETIDLKAFEKQLQKVAKSNVRPDTCACEVETGCLTIPARDDGAIPAADIYYKIQGKAHCSKPTLVFVHGYQSTAENWACQQNSLCESYRTVAFDMRGFGRSSKTIGIDYTMDLLADDIEAVLDELHIGKNIILIGESLGSGVVMNFAARKPDQLVKLVLMSGAPVYDIKDCGISAFCDVPTTCDAEVCYSFARPESLSNAETADLFACVAENPTPEGQLGCVVRNTLHFSLNEQCEDQQNLLIQRASQIVFYGFTAFTQMCGDVPCGAIADASVAANALHQNQLPILSDVTVPTLIVYGTIDNRVTPQNATVLFEGIKHSYLVGFVGKGHLPQNTAVKEFNDLLVDFVKGKVCKKPFLINAECDVCDVPFVFPFVPCDTAA